MMTLKCKIAKTNWSCAALRRAVLAGGLAASVLLTALGGVQAQTTPYPNQTPQPTPYSWPGFHAGGTALYPFYDNPPATGTSPTNPGAPYQALSPLYSQLMGTPSGFLLLNADGTLNPGTSVLSEVSSFLLGNYNPLLPPPTQTATDGTLAYFPNHFADDTYSGGIKSWSAPFTYLTPASSGQAVTDDNSSTTPQIYPTTAGTATGWTVSFAGTGGFAGTALTSNSAADNPIAPTGTPNYVRATAAATATAKAVWTFVAPTTAINATVAGLYTISLHLPIPLVNGDANYPETRIPDAHYVVKNVTTGVTLFDGKISQTETNDPQYLAGPFPVAATQTITVTLDNSTAATLSASTYVLADSVSLTPGSIAGGANAVNGSPTAINSTQYPEIQNALYLGQMTNLITGARTDDTMPYGNVTIGTPDTTTAGLQHSIYQLVYFGRYETIILTDATGNLVDATGKASAVPVTEQVGAIYCVNGITGDIVWRFQTPDILTRGTTAAPAYTNTGASQAVFTTPTVARINVLVPQGTAPETYKPATKLVVVVADDNGQVYCLDAIGNRNGTSNTTVLGTAGALTYDQPIYAPNAPLNTGTTISATAPHVGTTRAYWVYRPDQTKESQTASSTFGKIRAYDATRDLPKPTAFGTASPTVYVNPTVAIDKTTLAPNVNSSAATLISNARVFIGNSNGTMYALDAGGVVVAPKTSTAGATYLDSTDPYDTSRYVGISSSPITPGIPYMLTADNSPVPTAVPVWWFAVNGAQTSNTDATGNVSITSAPALRLTGAPATAPTATSTSFDTAPEVYFTTGNDTTNQGRVYALGLTGGPVTYTVTSGVATPKPLVPGSAGYNNTARPDWVFPNAYTNTGILKVRPPLGSITGSPVVFTNPDDKTTRVYVAANSNEDDVAPADQGRIWAIRAFPETTNFTNNGSISTNAPGEPVWCYPDYYNPNVYAPNNNETTPAKSLDGNTYANADAVPDPLGAFQFATPAIGVVQFPTAINYGAAGTTQYLHTDASPAAGVGSRTSNDVRGQNVPMLYVGGHIEAPDSSNFFALDLDGASDNQRNIFYDATAVKAGTFEPVGTTQGAAGFECSPLLIVNTSATTGLPVGEGPGNGGVVFITTADNNLFELSAVPTSDIGAGSTAPQFPNFIDLGGFGPFSSPAAAAFSGATLAGTSAGGGAQDWVYGGDGKLGIARGITPANLLGSGAAGIYFGTAGTGNDALAPTLAPLQFPLHTYIFKGDLAHPRTTADMSQANNVGQPLPAFEWGERVYIRISNVIPPNDAVLNSNGTLTTTNGSTTRYMADSTTKDASTIYTNGGPITITLSDVTTPGTSTAAGETDSVTIPATVLPDSLTVPTGPGLATTPPGNGFLHEQPSGTGAQDHDAELLTDNSGTGNAWIGATTYAIGDGSNRRNTPGSRRRIVSATQVAQAYTVDTNGNYKFAGSVTLQVNVDSTANQYTTFTGPGGTGTPGRRRIAPVDQPTFSILNPLAVQAGAYPLPIGANAPTAPTPALGAIPVVPPTNVGDPVTGILGPFGGVHSGATITTADLEAYANGNRIPRATTDIPLNGVVTGVQGTRRYQKTVLVITATGDINHGTTGDNADPRNLNAIPPTGNQGSGTALNSYVIPSTANAPYGPYALNVADRSALGNDGEQIHNLTVQPAAVRWHDNSAYSGSNVYGPGAMVNPLPWETEPTSGQAGTNTSLDYPDIGASRLNHNLIPNQKYPAAGGTTPATSGDLTNQAGSLDPALGDNPIDRVVYADPLQVQIRVPTYQSANLQVYDQTNANRQTTPDQLTANSVAFPEGYVTNETIYVDSNHNHKFDAGEAYRTFRVFTGVPVDMSTTMDTTTIDLGRLPQGFGLNTDSFPALGTFMPYPTTTQVSGNGTYLGNPQNPGYVQFFKPLHVSNRGNVNLLNIHLDQKVDHAGTFASLPLLGDTLDPLAIIPAYDTGFALTGPRPVLPSGTAAGPFLLRSSLDDDIAAAYGRNPALTAAGTPYTGLAATFHKARVSDAGPSVLTVPDVPHDNTPGYNGYLLPFTAAPPLAGTVGGTSALTDVNTTPNAVSGQPYIALAIPQGTPVGTYSQSVRLFEGVDSAGYKDIGVNGNGYVPILPPQYSNKIINPALSNPTGAVAYTPPATDLYNGLIDTWMLGANNTPMQPASSAAVIKATVTEGRLTNGASKGDLPQVDAQPSGNGTSGAASSANFLPSAFRDPTSGNVSVYWTTSRNSATTPYNLLGANLNFNLNADPTKGYFSPANANSNWWAPINLTAAAPMTGSLNSGISTFTGNGAAYALVQNVAGGGTTPITNNLRCYLADLASGALAPANALVTTNTSQSSFGARGLAVPSNTFNDALATTATPIPDNIFAFWYGGARGRSALYYSSSQAAVGAAPGAFGTTAVLPIPAGLVSVSDPTAVLSYAPNPAQSANNVPVIEVTYTGIAADGNADIYVSRYRPYFVRKSDNITIAKDANNNSIVALALLPSPVITEQLLSTDGNLYYQARDVAWARTDSINLFVGGFSVLQDLTAATNPDGSNPLKTSIKVTYDRQTGSYVYTGVPPIVTTAGQTYPVNAIYIDLARGRVRFSPQLPVGASIIAYATFAPQARRITTDSRADTAPIAFIDTANKTNDANIMTNGISNGIPDVEADRYWFIWRKSGAPGTSTTPTLYYKTQRLTVALHDANNQPISIQLDTNKRPIVTVNIGGSNVYTEAAGGPADVDWSRGRVYFPILIGGVPSEGQPVTVTCDYIDSTGNKHTGGKFTDVVHWLDEPRYNESVNPSLAASVPIGQTAGQTAVTAAATGDAAIPIDTVVNESNVTAFLDPKQPHKVWLFWNSTRNGTADLYYETFSPLFSASAGS